MSFVFSVWRSKGMSFEPTWPDAAVMKTVCIVKRCREFSYLNFSARILVPCYCLVHDAGLSALLISFPPSLESRTSIHPR
jgi:hypothetical protein